MTTSCYLHIPFCASKCPYCDFYSLAGQDGLRRAYAQRCTALLTQAARDHQWRTFYIGGGTPSVMEPDDLAEILQAAKPSLLPGAEVTIECNPSSVSEAFCRAIAGAVNRVSLGVQSAVPQERAALGRAGDLADVQYALHLLRRHGIENISLDVMLGIPGQTQESLAETLRFCAEHAQHISAYLLKIEPGTPFAGRPASEFPDEDAQAELYLYACEWLEAHGFAQYEISNFAQPGYESRHNLNYWRGGEYYAIGPGAHGYTQGRRWHYARDLTAFLQGAAPADDGPGGDFEEQAMLALRLREGLSNAPAEMLERAKRLTGLVQIDGTTIQLTREGFLLSNAVIGKLLF